MLLVVGFEAVQYLHRLFLARFEHVDSLEAAAQRLVLFERALVVLIGGRADTAQLARGQRRLQQIGRVHRAARSRAGADDRMDLVDEQDRRGLPCTALITALSRCSKSPRKRVPASNAPISSA